MDSPLKGKKVVIIGGTSGMGAGAALEALRWGADVIIAGRSLDKALDKAGLLAGEAGETGGSIGGMAMNVRDPDSIAEGLNAAGEFDHIFITASPGARSEFAGPVEDARDYFEGKFWSSYQIARDAATRLRPGGSILFVTGGLAMRPGGAVAVTAAFAAVEGLTRALAVELAPLRVNCIRPGFVNTEFWDFMDPAAREKLLAEKRKQVPVGKVGDAKDIGRAAVSLMTNEFISGVVLDVSGGHMLT